MRRFSLLLTVLALTVALAACGSSKKSDNADPGTTVATTPSSVASTSDAASFGTGLGWFFSNTDATTKEAVPEAVVVCVQPKLSASDVATISALKSNADSDNVADAVGIRVVRTVAGCDRAWLATFLGQKLTLAKLGVTSADQQACVTSGMIDAISALDDATATGTGGAGLNNASAGALGNCVTVVQGLTALLSSSGNIPADSVSCIADEAAKTLTWAALLSGSSDVQTTLTSAAQTCGVQ
jgi:hypothetical protein